MFPTESIRRLSKKQKQNEDNHTFKKQLPKEQFSCMTGLIKRVTHARPTEKKQNFLKKYTHCPNRYLPPDSIWMEI